MQTSITRRSLLAGAAATLALAALPAIVSVAPYRMGVEVLDYDGTVTGEGWKWKRISGLDSVKRAQMFRFVAPRGMWADVPEGQHLPAPMGNEWSSWWYGLASNDGALELSPSNGKLEGACDAEFFEYFESAYKDWKRANLRLFEIGEPGEVYAAYSEAEVRKHYIEEVGEDDGRTGLGAHFAELDADLDAERDFRTDGEDGEISIRSTWREMCMESEVPGQVSTEYL